MRVLLDECLPRRLTRELPGHFVRTVPQAGWARLRNGALLSRIGGAFDAFVTVDRNLPNQQNLAGLQFGIIVLSARSNALPDLLPVVPDILTALSTIKAGDVVQIPAHTP